MDEIERYFFDTQGYVVIPDVLSSEDVQRLTRGVPRRVDGTVADRSDPADKRMLSYPDQLFRELINHHRILPYLSALLSPYGQSVQTDAPPFYLVQAYVMSMRAGDTGPWFHNGGAPHEPWWAYSVHEGRIFSRLTAVIWILSDAAEGDGGFWCIPGSHKANFPLPRAIETYEVVPACVVQPAVRSGSVIIFSEALTHGTRRWTAAHERVALFYKYAPNWIADPWSTFWQGPAAEAVPLMTADQLRYVRRPGTG